MVGGESKPSSCSALAYLKTVKYTFRYQCEKYDEFLEILTDYSCRRVDFLGVIRRLKELFKGHQELLVGFNTFMPKGLKMTLEPEDGQHPPKPSVNFMDAIKFVSKVKRRFQEDDRPYRSLIDIVKSYRKEEKSSTEVYYEVSILFRDHKDLLAEFTHFMPDAKSDSDSSDSVTSPNSW
ncbi:PREDICTED: paired amphipathic helix protein Sin3-like 4 [Camelina sativa]|uniref:Paired amphipathic helix protein Sin3-like 4 n=1 Tax=Camelina sativa TaxID=90675 RepID=A0ABM0X4R1_CAMSA|nr:PREDICTED: paired amphipathic helix protein Sin3-like 4 [Camelina sativa]